MENIASALENTTTRERIDIFEHAFTDLDIVKPFITLERVEIGDIITPQNRTRKQGLKGLKATVNQFGVLLPPIVMQTENKKKYILINGIRRIYAALKNGFTELDVLVYNFEDSVKAKRAIPILELILNQTEPYTVEEVWEASKYLSKRMVNCQPDLIEYLLNLRPGEYMKLYDIMMADETEMIDVIEQLKDGGLTINQAYKKLDTIRKRISRQDILAQNDILYLDGSEAGDFKDSIENLEASVDAPKRERLSDDEIASLLNLSNSSLSNIDADDIESLDRTDEIRKSKRQDTKERKPVDPAIRRARMVKDGYTCQCCEAISGEEHMYILDFHHRVPVFLGGQDSVENGITLCLNCHQLVHLYAFGDLFLDLNTLSKDKIIKFKKIMSLGNIIIDGMQKLNISRKEGSKAENPHFVGRKYPATIKRQLEKAD